MDGRRISAGTDDAVQTSTGHRAYYYVNSTKHCLDLRELWYIDLTRFYSMKTARHATSILLVLLWLLFVAATPGSSRGTCGANAERVSTDITSVALCAPPASSSSSIGSPNGQSPYSPQGEKEKRRGKPVMRSWDALRALPIFQAPLPRVIANLGVADSRTGIFVPCIYPSTRTLRAPPVS